MELLRGKRFEKSKGSKFQPACDTMITRRALKLRGTWPKTKTNKQTMKGTPFFKPYSSNLFSNKVFLFCFVFYLIPLFLWSDFVWLSLRFKHVFHWPTFFHFYQMSPFALCTTSPYVFTIRTKRESFKWSDKVHFNKKKPTRGLQNKSMHSTSTIMPVRLHVHTLTFRKALSDAVLTCTSTGATSTC